MLFQLRDRTSGVYTGLKYILHIIIKPLSIIIYLTIGNSGQLLILI